MARSFSPTLAPPAQAPSWLAGAWRYGLSTAGPVATSGAHFLASLIFVRNLPASEFGLFSFALVIVPFAMSMAGALLVLPVNAALGEPVAARARIEASCLKMNLALTVLAGLAVFAFLAVTRAPVLPALLLAGFGAALTFRWFARCFSFVQGRAGGAITSDFTYAGILIAGLGMMQFLHRVEFLPGMGLLLLAALGGLLPFGKGFFREQFAAIAKGRLRDYRAIFRDLTRWSLTGVIFTELTVNAHAYLVTFISGPGPFALLAVGQILMRPASLVQSALPDMELPRMTRALAAGKEAHLPRMMRDFRFALLGVWLATVSLAVAILSFAPELLLRKGYALSDIALVTLITAAIMLVRCVRAPLATFLQAAGQFKALAGIGLTTSPISILLTLSFLLTLGPIASLLGILTGEIVIVLLLKRVMRNWKTGHG
jgi:O-antigen/teichoic acid export membrane protein